ncbi:MAG: hypothetical protein WEC34_03625, partial [Acidimicrobiia bacterium]
MLHLMAGRSERAGLRARDDAVLSLREHSNRDQIHRVLPFRHAQADDIGINVPRSRGVGETDGMETLLAGRAFLEGPRWH